MKINCKINEGEVLGLVGDNGAGKSTLVKILAGVYPPTSGSILYNGNSIKFKDPSHSRSLGIEIVYQDLGLVDIMNIGQNFFLGKEPTKTAFSLLDFKKIFGESLASISKLGIHLNDAEQNVGKLSGGQKKSIAISRSLYFGVKVLMLDEPTASMDEKLTRLMEDLLEKWHTCSAEFFPAPNGQQAKRAWIWVSHNSDQLTKMCGQTYNFDTDDGK